MSSLVGMEADRALQRKATRPDVEREMPEEYLGDEDRRRAPRFGVRAPTEFANGESGQGFTENLSMSGVLLATTSNRASPGTELELRFSLFAGSFDTTFRGTVVRLTEDGFAVQFDTLATAQLELLHRALPERVSHV
jgi:hypothetical protein